MRCFRFNACAAVSLRGVTLRNRQPSFEGRRQVFLWSAAGHGDPCKVVKQRRATLRGRTRDAIIRCRLHAQTAEILIRRLQNTPSHV